MKVKVIKNKLVEINKTMDPSMAYGEFIGLAKISSNHIPLIEREIKKKFLKKINFKLFLNWLSKI